jgi:hypothetical protein
MYITIEPENLDCIRDAFRKSFGICALFFALDEPQGSPRQSPMRICSKPLRNPPKANRGFRVEKACFQAAKRRYNLETMKGIRVKQFVFHFTSH